MAALASLPAAGSWRAVLELLLCFRTLWGLGLPLQARRKGKAPRSTAVPLWGSSLPRPAGGEAAMEKGVAASLPVWVFGPLAAGST